MLNPATSVLILSYAAFVSALPNLESRAVASLNQAAFEEAQQRDETATRLFSSTSIKTSDGQCLFVDELSGDFRANLTPIQVATCDGSVSQSWDIITAGKHNDQPGTILVVNSQTQACMNFDPRRAAGNQVIMFSCGGRADGGGEVTNSQLFSFAGGEEPVQLEPENAAGTCFTVKNNVLDQAPCQDGETSQTFSFGGTENEATPSSAVEESPASTTSAAATIESPSTTEDCFSTTMVTVTRGAGASTSATTTPGAAIEDSNPTTDVPVSRVGGRLQPSAAAESNQRDANAVRAFSSVSLKSSTGDCLSVDPTAGDFRQNLIPIAVTPCTGSAGEKWDLITSGTHNDDTSGNSTLIVSALTQGCMNFDPRRAAGDTVILFSCGGRADGEGSTTNSQLFPFVDGQNSIVITPENAEGTCLVGKNGKLDSASCSGGAEQSFTIV